MDVMKLIQSLDEALYSVMSWLVFYPLTFWRTMIRPLEMMAYADREASDRGEDQYDDAIRPPLFLFITLLISHGFELLVMGQNPLIADRHGLAALVDSDFALLGLRLLLFSLFTLTMAVTLLRRQGTRLTHTSLRRPFYGQCFAAAPFALLIGIGTLMMSGGRPMLDVAGLVTIVAALVWYLGVQSLWFSRKLGISMLAGFGNAALATVISLVLFVSAAVIIS